MGRQARVRVAEPLRFLLPVRRRHGDLAVPVDGVSSLLHVVESLGVPRTEFGELRVNGLVTAPSERPLSLRASPAGQAIVRVRLPAPDERSDTG